MLKKVIKPSLVVLAALIATGCAQKVTIKALQPAEVGEMASKKKVAVTPFKNDTVGLSGKIEAQIAKQKLDKKRYFTVISRKDLDKVIAEQKLQSTDMMDESTSAKIGKLTGAQAIITGEVAVANAESGSYMEDRERCLRYAKDGSGCVSYKHYKVKCNTTQATVGANINIVDVEKGSIIYADTINKEYSADSCKAGNANLGLITIQGAPKQILSKAQALNHLATQIAKEFVYKLTPNYIYFQVNLLDSIDVEDATDQQTKNFEIALKYIEQGRYDKAKKIFEDLMKAFDGKSYAVAYNLGVVYEATGDFDKAKEMYTIADEHTVEPVPEINDAINRIDDLIAKREEAIKQMNAK